MKIECIGEFPRIRRVNDYRVRCIPELDRVALLDFGMNKIDLHELSSGKRVGGHCANSTLRVHHREGRWLIVSRSTKDTSFGLFDLEVGVIHKLDFSIGTAHLPMHMVGASGKCLLFGGSLPARSLSYAFRLGEGEPANLIPQPTVAGRVSFVGGSFWGRFEMYGTCVLRTYRLDEEGFPTMGMLGESDVEGTVLAAWADRFLLWSHPKGRAGLLKCLDANCCLVHECELPPGHDSRDAYFLPWTAIVQGKSEARLMVWRAAPETKYAASSATGRLTCLDLEDGHVLWSRDMVVGYLRSPFVLGAHLVSHDEQGMDLIDTDTGESERLELPNAMIYSGSGNCLRREELSSIEPDGPYFFWQRDGDVPLQMGRLEAGT